MSARPDVEPSAANTPPLEDFLDRLPRRLSRTLSRTRGGRLVTLSVRAPMAAGLPGHGPAVYWSRGADGTRSIGAGSAMESTAVGEGRFAALGEAWRQWTADWTLASLDGAAPRRAAFLGFAFSPTGEASPLPNSLLWVPAVVAECRGRSVVLHFSGTPGQDDGGLVEQWVETARGLARAPRSPLGSDSSPAAPGEAVLADPGWTDRVLSALAAIRGQALEKLVLTRRLDLPLGRSPSLGSLLAWLSTRHPLASVFAVRREGASFVGASPERLVHLEDGMVLADALAGSAPRSPDREADRKLGAALMASDKALAEHDVVVREILAALEPLCSGLVASRSPSLLRLPTVQHLASRVHGRVRPGAGVFELLERMHPTPAVGGAPRQPALDWLYANGEADRGWYTGGVGWVDERGGDVWVALRCATLAAGRASLFAGAGIVAGSDPRQELDETGWKLATMLEALAIG